MLEELVLLELIETLGAEWIVAIALVVLFANLLTVWLPNYSENRLVNGFYMIANLLSLNLLKNQNFHVYHDLEGEGGKQ